MKIETDKILHCILNGEQDKALKELYTEVMPMARKYILRNSGTTDDAFDVFQDSLLILIRYVREKKYDATIPVTNFLLSVCRNLWINKAKKKGNNHKALNDNFDMVSSENLEKDLISNERKKTLEHLIDLLGERCQRIMKLVFYEEMSMKNIAIEMGLSGEDVAKSSHYKCKQKLIEIIKSNSWATNLLRYEN